MTLCVGCWKKGWLCLKIDLWKLNFVGSWEGWRGQTPVSISKSIQVHQTLDKFNFIWNLSLIRKRNESNKRRNDSTQVVLRGNYKSFRMWNKILGLESTKSANDSKLHQISVTTTVTSSPADLSKPSAKLWKLDLHSQATREAPCLNLWSQTVSLYPMASATHCDWRNNKYFAEITPKIVKILWS